MNEKMLNILLVLEFRSEYSTAGQGHSYVKTGDVWRVSRYSKPTVLKYLRMAEEHGYVKHKVMEWRKDSRAYYWCITSRGEDMMATARSMSMF